jgi:regulator-associated protein of mTOR
MYELQTWLGTPCIYVLDCSAAGLIINNFRSLMDTRQQQLALQQQQVGGLRGPGGMVIGEGLSSSRSRVVGKRGA